MNFFKKLKLKVQKREGVSIIFVGDSKEGVEISQRIIEAVVDGKTALFLSGGRTPKELYTVLASDQKLKAGAVGLIDERYGEKFHPQSNELMIQQTGFLSFLEKQNIKFFPILEGKDRGSTAKDYDETLRYLLGQFPKSLAILGVGGDGHTAGIPAINPCHTELVSASQKETRSRNPLRPSLTWFRSEASKFGMTNDDMGEKLVFEYNDEGGFYNERVTMTFAALARIDVLLVLVFGDDKKEALKKMFEEGSLEEIPARFLKQKGIAEKVVLITDQKI